MTEEKRESTRNLLDEIEQGWGADSSAGADAKTAVPGKVAAKAALEPTSSPDVDQLDLGWLDDLFPDGEDSESDEDEEDEPEPELPDERLDPEAFAAAKKARDERLRSRRDKKRAKAEAKRTRQKAREAGARQKQKAKKNRPAVARPAKPASDDRTRTPNDLDSQEEDEPTRPSTPPAKLRAKSKPPTAGQNVAIKKRANTIASVKLLAVVLLVLVGGAALFAALAR